MSKDARTRQPEGGNPDMIRLAIDNSAGRGASGSRRSKGARLDAGPGVSPKSAT